MAKMAKINSVTLLRGDCSLLQKEQQLIRESALPKHPQLSLFVPLPLPAPESDPDIY